MNDPLAPIIFTFKLIKLIINLFLITLFFTKVNLIQKSMKKLPDIYRISKLPKHPFNARFIVDTLQCSVKPLSKAFLLY